MVWGLSWPGGGWMGGGKVAHGLGQAVMSCCPLAGWAHEAAGARWPVWRGVSTEPASLALLGFLSSDGCSTRGRARDASPYPCLSFIFRLCLLLS